jgi:type II secretory pathway component GspD/PulD (secretin)
LNNQKVRSSIYCAGLIAAALVIAGYTPGALAQASAGAAAAGADVYQTLYLTNLSQANDAEALTSDLRNMLPRAKLIYVASQGAISFRGSSEDLAMARKILSDLDKTKKIYRLTYTMTEKDGVRTIGVQHFSVIVASGSTTVLKVGSRVPVATSSSSSRDGNTEVTYIDVGQEIEASLDSYLDGVRLRTKVVQSGIAEDKSASGTPDPLIRQTTLEGTSTLAQGKSLVLGSLDVPGSTRSQEVEVVSELVR